MFFLDLFRELQTHGVRYVAVGGIALNLHGDVARAGGGRCGARCKLRFAKGRLSIRRNALRLLRPTALNKLQRRRLG